MPAEGWLTGGFVGGVGRAMGRPLGRRTAHLLLAAVLGAVSGVLSPATAQERAANIRVFVDCAGDACDEAHLQREIPFVDWVRDQADADVHVLVTEADTGGGGARYAIWLTGQRAFEGLSETLGYTSSAVQTDAEARDGLTRTIEAGLFRYAARTPTLHRIDLSYDPETEVEASPQEDPWKRWVFRTSVGGSFSAEERSDFISFRASQTISRVTEGMKLSLAIGGRYNESNFDTSDTTTVTSITRSFESELLYVASLGSHWGVGFRASSEHSTFRNYDLAFRFAPAIEFNIFPYDESTRRQFRILYAAGPRYFDYDEETIFFQTEETRVEQSLTVSLEFEQPWGNAILALQGSHYFDEIERNRLEGYGFVSVRLFKGLGMFVETRAARVRDQINLPRGDATVEEVLLRQRELATDFELEGSVGFDITFGSIFSDVVNPRFGS